tara:strand:- start:1330 stop:1512 length:183 start_codon:yes stop_codon:yes gene_type:complete
VKVDDWVRFKHKRRYGVVIEVDGVAVRVLWQGMSCRMTWVPEWDLVGGVENELMSFRGGK